MSLFHNVHYQGVLCREGYYRRSAGLSPDTGYVEVDVDAIGKEMRIVAGDVSWRPVSGKEFPQTSIVGWSELRGRRTVSVKGFKPAHKRPNKGLANVGDLVFQTWENRKKLPEVRYSDIYIDKNGAIEEVEESEEFAELRTHKVGFFRVPITDIRAQYPGRGAFISKINARLATGEPDLDTNNPKTKKPWTVKDVLQYLFSQLPGSPSLALEGEWNDLGGQEAAPTMVGKGEPVVEALQQLLDELGLKPQMLPNGHYTLSSKFSKRVPYGKYPTEVGKLTNVPREIHRELKDVRVTNRPACVQVFGGPVIQRSVHPYVPVFIHNKKIYKLKELHLVIPGYSEDKAAEQALRDGEGAFSDLDDLNHREMLRKHAWRTYAPAHIFNLPISKRTQSGASFVPEEDLAKYPYLPFTDVPFYVSELQDLRKVPRDTDKEKGDRDDLILSEPLVYAQMVGPALVQDFSGLDEIFSRQMSRGKDYLGYLQQQLRDEDEQLKDVAKVLERSQVTSEDAARRTSWVERYGLLMLSRSDSLIPGVKTKTLYGHTVNGDVRINADLQIAMTEVGVELQFARLAGEKMNDSTFAAISRAEAIKQKRAQTKESIRKLKLNLKKIERSHGDYKKVYEETGTLWLPHANVPHGLVPTGSYSLDERTGLLVFGDHACHMVQPYVLDQDRAVVGADGVVTVVAASEYVDNVQGGLTSVLVTAQGEDPIKISYAGLCRSTPLKPMVESMGDISLYLTEFGASMNAGAVISAAMGKAFGQLSMPKSIEGYTYTIDGMIQAVLDGGVDSVEHHFDGTAVGYTTISVNSPNARTPIGIPKHKAEVVTDGYRRRLAIEQG